MPETISPANKATAAVATALAVTVTASLLWLRRKNKHEKQTRTLRQEGCEKIRLLPCENSFVVKTTPPSSSITIFETDALQDVQAAQEHFEKRTMAIVEANPWLTGFLDVDESDPDKKLALYVPSFLPANSDSTSSQCSSFVVLDDLGKLSIAEYPSMVQTLTPAMIGNTMEHVASVEKPSESYEPLWQVAFVPKLNDTDDDTDGKVHRFAIVVSGNHSILDGHGYYRLFNMLSSQEPVQALSPIRKHDLEPSIATATGTTPTEPSLLANPPISFVFGFIASTIRNAIFPQTQSTGLMISNEWIAQQKEAYQASIRDTTDKEGLPPYVSTNDLVVSNFCQLCGCELGLVAMNLRGRAEGCTDDLVGNYEHLLAYTKRDCATPARIRQSLANGPPYRRVGATDGSSDLPTPLEHLTSCSYGAITNWATFAKELDVGGDGVRQTMHLPLFDFPKSTPACNWSSMVIFRPRKGEIGILAGGTQAFVDRLRESDMVGSVLY